MKENNITELSTSFGRRTVTNDRIDFGIRRTNNLIHLLHWVQDAWCVLYTPSTDRYDQASLLTALTVTGERADVRKIMKRKIRRKS